jgi:hypothetical protein
MPDDPEKIQNFFLEALKKFVSLEKNQTTFAQKVGVTKGLITHLLKERNKGNEATKRQIAANLGFPDPYYNQFLDIGRDILAGREPRLEPNPWGELLTADELEGHEYFKVPFSENMKLAAGQGGTLPADYIPYTNDKEDSKIIVYGPALGRLTSRNLQAFRVGGDSMEPIIAKGGLVMADTSERTIRATPDGLGKIFVLCWELDSGECAVKYLTWADQASGLVLISSPPYSGLTPIHKNIKDIIIIGQVIWACRDFK